MSSPVSSQHGTKSHVGEPFWKQVLQPQSSLQMTAALATILTSLSRQPLSPNDPMELLPDS